MEMYVIVVSVIFTILVLVLSILTITKGYGYKHKVDPLGDTKSDNNNVNSKTHIDN